MMPSRSACRAEQFADLAGVVSFLIGLGLVLAPERASALLVLPTGGRSAQRVGYLDLGLAGGLLLSPRRRPWMLARASMNAVLALHYRRVTPGRSQLRRQRFSQALVALTAFDASVAVII